MLFSQVQLVALSHNEFQFDSSKFVDSSNRRQTSINQSRTVFKICNRLQNSASMFCRASKSPLKLRCVGGSHCRDLAPGPEREPALFLSTLFRDLYLTSAQKVQRGCAGARFRPCETVFLDLISVAISYFITNLCNMH